MGTRSRRYRTQRIVRREMDVVRFAPAGNLTRLCQPTGDTQINPRVIHELLFNHLPERPLTGPLLADGQRHGAGKMEYRNGDVYNGQWVRNKKHGDGRIDYVVGGSYTGGWINDIREGHGVNVYPNDDMFEGEFECSLRGRTGTMFYKNGNIYKLSLIHI